MQCTFTALVVYSHRKPDCFFYGGYYQWTVIFIHLIKIESNSVSVKLLYSLGKDSQNLFIFIPPLRLLSLAAKGLQDHECTIQIFA